MIVSETRRFVFIHNPKAGGTTVRGALMPFDTTGHFFWMFAETHNARIDKAHLPMHVLRRVFPEQFAQLASYFVFMLVRDPYRRAISAFNETRPELLNAMHKAQAAPQADVVPQAGAIQTARQTYKDTLNGFISQLHAQHLNGWSFDHRHWVRQRDMAYLGPKRMVDLVLKLEDWPACVTALGAFDPTLQTALQNLAPFNVKPLPFTPMDSLTPASIARINELYRDDFLIFNYKML